MICSAGCKFMVTFSSVSKVQPPCSSSFEHDIVLRVGAFIPPKHSAYFQSLTFSGIVIKGAASVVRIHIYQRNVCLRNKHSVAEFETINVLKMTSLPLVSQSTQPSEWSPLRMASMKKQSPSTARGKCEFGSNLPGGKRADQCTAHMYSEVQFYIIKESKKKPDAMMPIHWHTLLFRETMFMYGLLLKVAIR